FQFAPTFKIFMDSNHKPEVRGTDNAIWDRIKLIPFMVSIPDEEKDRHLLDKLKAEASGILLWAVEGCLEWRRDGLKEPKCVAIATDEYREEMNVFTEFLDDECILGASLEDTVENLYRSYTAWCTRHNEQHMTKKSFGAS